MSCSTQRALIQQDLEPSRFTCNPSGLIEASVATDNTLVGTGSTDNPLSVVSANTSLCSTFMDEMWGTLAGSWITRVTTGSRSPMTKDNGWIEFTTGAVATNEESVDFNDYLMFSAVKNPAFYTRIQLPDIADVEVAIGLVGLASNDYIRFFYSAASAITNWRVQASDAGSATSVTTSSPVTTNEVELYWVMPNPTQVDFYIDGVLAGSIGVNVPVNSLQPYIVVVTETNAAKDLYVDYVRIVQDRT